MKSQKKNKYMKIVFVIIYITRSRDMKLHIHTIDEKETNNHDYHIKEEEHRYDNIITNKKQKKKKNTIKKKKRRKGTRTR